MAREIKGVDALAKAFPKEWLLYVSLNCFPRGQDPMEIDALVVTDDRVLVLEIKDWNGRLTSARNSWFVNGQFRGRSPVVLINEKAKRLKTVFKAQLGGAGKNLWVDARVVLTGTSTREELTPDEKPYVWTLQEACSITDSDKSRKLLNTVRLSMFKAYQFESDFERVFGNAQLFRAAEADWSGYRIVEKDVFVHPRRVWSDHIAERRGETRIKALVRTWAFEELPPGLNSPAMRRLVALRETQAFAHLQSVGSSLISANRVLREVATPGDEIVTHHYEVRSLTHGCTTYDRYLERAAEFLSRDDRIVIASALLNLVAELHRCSLFHRDIGPRSVWLGSPSDLALTGFMSCQLPDQGTVFDWLSELRGYAPLLPEDAHPTYRGTGRQRDVYACAYLVAMALTGTRPTADALVGETIIPDEFAAFRQWIRRGVNADPAQRFPDAITMAQEFSELVEASSTPAIDQSLLDRFETSAIPFQKWLTRESLASKADCSVYMSEDPTGAKVTVKVWTSVRRGRSPASDAALLTLLDSAARLRGSPISGLPKIQEVGLSPVGPFIVYGHIDGESFEVSIATDKDLLQKLLAFLTAVAALHDLGCSHGDVAPHNIVIARDSRSLVLVDPFDIAPIGEGRVRTPVLCPLNWEHLSLQALDRYAALRMVNDLVRRSSFDVPALAATLQHELRRDSIESLEPAISALRSAVGRLAPSPARRIAISSTKHFCGFSGRGPLFISRQITNDIGTEKIWISGTDGHLILEGDGDHITAHDFRHFTFSALAQDSGRGAQANFVLDLTAGEDSGFEDLYRALRQHRDATAAPPDRDDATQQADAIDVTYHWKRLMELEGEDRVEVEVKDVIAAREGVIICRIESVGSEFDFDDEDTIDVLNQYGKRVAEVDHSLSDFPAIVGLRCDERRVSVGDRLRLADRKEQASIDRRTKAVDRILERRSAIPNLIDFFSADCSVPAETFTYTLDDTDLARYELNSGQRDAFRSILANGPLGLLQGPPGTGKTRFIAALVHWLLSKGGSERILIASQSHEAVNNAIESLLLLHKRLGGRPNLLRIGSKGITERIKPYHSAELRERYRVRFENAARFRFLQLCSAKGIPRGYAAEAFKLDQELGVLARRCATLQQLSESDPEPLRLDRDRSRAQLSRAEKALRAAAQHLLQRQIDTAQPIAEFSSGLDELITKHPGVSPGDATATKRLLQLTRDWMAALASPQRNFEEFLAKTRSVVAATCVGVGQTRIRIDSHVFDWVVVDEAARCTPGELAVPIQMAKRVLLVGDHLQLKPMIVRELMDRLEHEEPDIDRIQLEMSDFERAFSSPYGRTVGTKFTEQYRMDPAICRLVSKCFYEKHAVQLETSKSRSSVLSFGPTTPPWLRKPICWIDTSTHPRSQETRPAKTTTRSNEAEVEAIITLLEDIATDKALVDQLQNSDRETPIGVICMYAGQKRRIETAWTNHAWDTQFSRLVQIDTVDSYQGKENDIVIVSLVACNHYGDVGHVGSHNRCNVAISRARERLIIVGSLSMWSGVKRTTPMAEVLAHLRNDSDNATVINMQDVRPPQ